MADILYHDDIKAVVFGRPKQNTANTIISAATPHLVSGKQGRNTGIDPSIPDNHNPTWAYYKERRRRIAAAARQASKAKDQNHTRPASSVYLSTQSQSHSTSTATHDGSKKSTKKSKKGSKQGRDESDENDVAGRSGNVTNKKKKTMPIKKDHDSNGTSTTDGTTSTHQHSDSPSDVEKRNTSEDTTKKGSKEDSRATITGATVDFATGNVMTVTTEQEQQDRLDPVGVSMHCNSTDCNDDDYYDDVSSFAKETVETLTAGSSQGRHHHEIRRSRNNHSKGSMNTSISFSISSLKEKKSMNDDEIFRKNRVSKKGNFAEESDVSMELDAIWYKSSAEGTFGRDASGGKALDNVYSEESEHGNDDGDDSTDDNNGCTTYEEVGSRITLDDDDVYTAEDGSIHRNRKQGKERDGGSKIDDMKLAGTKPDSERDSKNKPNPRANQRNRSNNANDPSKPSSTGFFGWLFGKEERTVSALNSSVSNGAGGIVNLQNSTVLESIPETKVAKGSAERIPATMFQVKAERELEWKRRQQQEHALAKASDHNSSKHEGLDDNNHDEELGINNSTHTIGAPPQQKQRQRPPRSHIGSVRRSDEEQEAQKRRNRLILIFVMLLILLGATIVPLVVVVGGNRNVGGTDVDDGSSNVTNTPVPSSSPDTIFGSSPTSLPESPLSEASVVDSPLPEASMVVMAPTMQPNIYIPT